MCWVSVKNCPCCNEKISLNNLWQIIAKSNLDEHNLLRCIHCDKAIGRKKILDRYSIIFSILLALIGLFIDNVFLLLSLIILLIVIFVYYLDKIVQLECRYKKYN